MFRTRCFLIVLLILTKIQCSAQIATYFFEDLNSQRIHTNIAGMTVLGSWGAINTIGGIAGYLSSGKEETQRFYQMNALWGIANFGIATAGYLGTQKELRKKYSCAEALKRYRATRRLYLINAGLDGAYIATGFALIAHSHNVTNNVDAWRGYGNALILQGVGLLAFDITMFTSHGRKNSMWIKAMQGVCFTGNGIGWHHSL